MRDFNGKVVVITGSSMGIGRNLAEKLAAKGARIVLNSRGETQLMELSRSMSASGYEVLAVQADVSRLSDCQMIVEAAISRFGRIDLLINNAGVNMLGRLEDIEPASLSLTMEVNYHSALYMTRLCLPYLKEYQGGLVFISSAAGIHGLPLHTGYSAAKMALRALAEGVKAELSGTGVYVGIAYVGITENQPGKTIYNSKGEKIAKEDVKRYGMQPIPMVTDGIIHMIEQRKFMRTFSFLGKLNAIMNRISPALVQYILTRAYLKKGW